MAVKRNYVIITKKLEKEYNLKLEKNIGPPIRSLNVLTIRKIIIIVVQ